MYRIDDIIGSDLLIFGLQNLYKHVNLYIWIGKVFLEEATLDAKVDMNVQILGVVYNVLAYEVALLRLK